MDSFAARQACRDGRYDEVLAMYGKAAPDRSWTCWDYYYYAYALRKVKNYAKGREIARAGHHRLSGIYQPSRHLLLVPLLLIHPEIRRTAPYL